MKSILLMCYLLSANITLIAQADTTWSQISSRGKFSQKTDKITSSRAYQMAYIAVPLIIGGLLVKDEDDHFRGLRNEYIPSFRHHYDNYLQYLPAATMIGLKIGGVKGRSSWGRMLVSDAFSAIIMAATVNTLKTTIHVTRPDGSNKHSFPSGHTATAFMTATMMSKEYGSVSPWFSIGAYSVATATGLTRQLNNKHWLSDVMVGAGIGILSTEIGYFLADLIFKDKGITDHPVTEIFDKKHKPSFLGIYLGYNISPGNYDLPDGTDIHISTGSNAGIEGAWFITPYMGIGGRFSVSNMPITIDNKPQDDALDIISGYGGVYFSYPITTRWLAGSKVLAGYSYSPTYHRSPLITGKEHRFSMGTGGSFTYLAKQNLGVKVFLDYNFQPYNVQPNNKNVQIFTLGSAVTIAF